MVLVGVTISLPSAARAFPGIHVGNGWCGEDVAKDWVCWRRGVVLQQGSRIPFDHPVLAREGTPIVTASRSKARLSFKAQATCTLGELSQIFPRTGAANSLYSQKRGWSSCTDPTGTPVKLFCDDPEEPCPAEVRTKGTSLYKFSAGGTAAASISEEERHRVRIVSCSGSIRIKLENGEVFAGGPRFNGRLIVQVEELVLVLGEGHEVRTRIIVTGQVPGRGECADRAIQMQEAAALGSRHPIARGG